MISVIAIAQVLGDHFLHKLGKGEYPIGLKLGCRVRRSRDKRWRQSGDRVTTVPPQELAHHSRPTPLPQGAGAPFKAE